MLRRRRSCSGPERLRHGWRIERKLNKLDGVTAPVNYATEKAKVHFPGDLDPADLVRTVEQARYGAALPRPERTEPEGADEVDPTAPYGSGSSSRPSSPSR